jgi:methionyl-tRNA formyltransferase
MSGWKNTRDPMPPATIHPQRLILMGTGPFAVPAFGALLNAGHEIALVVTKPQPPVRSRKGPPPSPVRTWAEEHRLEIFDPVSINEPDAISRIREVGAELSVVCDYGQILKPDALAATPRGGINLHGSLLPAYRGAAPVQRALLNGDRVTGVAVIHMTPKLDGGPILAIRETEIKDHETAGELEERLALLGVEAVLTSIALLSQWDGASEIGTPQDSSKVSKAPRLSKAEGEIDWRKTAREIDCHVRGMQPWPVAYTHIGLQAAKPPVRLAIKRVQISSVPRGSAAPGEVVAGAGFLVATGDGVIEIKRIQPAGKREMDSEEFLRGHQISAGMKLTTVA